MTEKVYEELDDAKAEIEKLKAEYSVKVDLCDNLKRSYNDQLKRIEELNLKLEKQAQEVEAKADEVYAAKQSVEDLQCKLKEKEDIIKKFTSTNDKLRVDLKSKLQECEEEKSKLVSSLEEANDKISDLEHKNRAFMDKIEVLREGIVSVSQKKCANESKIAKASQRMRETGDMYEKLEEEKVKLEEQFKWKNEQFKHLEEAHEKLRNTLREKEKEWDVEKCTYLDNMSALETKLDSQLKLSEVNRRRLGMCSQALGREENRSKDLDVQLAESNLRIEEIKSQLEEMTIKRDEDVGNLEKLLAEKECAFQELECKRGKLEEENRELVLSVKKNKDLANKRKEDIGNLEKLLAEKECAIQEMEGKRGKLEEENRELVLSLEENKDLIKQRDEDIGNLEKLLAENECVIQEMECKIGKLEEENRELVLSLKETKECNSSSIAKLQDKLTTLEQIHKECSHHSKDREAEWSSKMEKMVADLNSCTLELESKEARLKDITTELDDLNSLVLQLTMEKQESEIMVVATKSTLLEAKSKIDEENCNLVKVPAEIESVKSVEEKLVQTRSELMNVCDLLEKANEELAESYCEVNEFEFELQLWKSVAEKLKVDLELNHRMRKEVEDSLLSQVATEVNLKEDLEEKERRVNDLEKQLTELKEKSRLKLAKDNGAELEKWEQEWVTKELEAAILAQLESEKIHEHEKQSLNQLVEEKDQRISNLQNIMSSLEEEFDHSSASFSTQLAEMQAEMKLFHEAWEAIRTTVVLKEIEVQEKNLMIKELEKDLEKQTAFEKECLFSVEKLSSENENLVEIIRGVSDRIKKLSREDGQMMGTLRSIMSGFDENCGHLELKERFDPLKENSNCYQSPKRNIVETSPDGRSPLRALNN
ncbi:hypothetical protein CTI12_AA382810 [Artemisia annua]|uniref:Uncharacterized protein n=1 Tax=Artemisia annua TaxID=35608 RepID=A0A2U1MGE4_ARTAN|nr:hypothetical protein CTI12_AA382810 [Artemisia annua]